MNSIVDQYPGNPPQLGTVIHNQNEISTAFSVVRVPTDQPSRSSLFGELSGLSLGTDELNFDSALDFMQKTTAIAEKCRKNNKNDFSGFGTVISLNRENLNPEQPDILVTVAGRLAIVGIFANPNQIARLGSSASPEPRISNSITDLDIPGRTQPFVCNTPFEGIHVIVGPPRKLLLQAGILSPNNLKRDLSMYARLAISPKPIKAT